MSGAGTSSTTAPGIERENFRGWLVIEDEFTRDVLAVEVRRSFKATDVLDVLSELMLIRGAPRHIRSDNGPEFIAKAIQKFLEQTGVETLYIAPGSPWQNHYNHRRPHSSLGYVPPARFAAEPEVHQEDDDLGLDPRGDTCERTAPAPVR